MLPATFDGVTGYASSAGFDGIFTGGKPCKIEKNFNPGADLRSVARKLIRGIMVVTPARRDVDITLCLLMTPLEVETQRIAEHVLAETGWLDGSPEMREIAYAQMSTVYEARLSDYMSKLGAPDADRGTAPEIADELYFEAVRLSAWRRGGGWLYLAVVHHDKETPVFVACGFRGRQA